MWCIRVKIDRSGARDEDFGTFICNDWTTNQYFVVKRSSFFLHVSRFIQDNDSHRQHNLDTLWELNHMNIHMVAIFLKKTMVKYINKKYRSMLPHLNRYGIMS